MKEEIVKIRPANILVSALFGIIAAVLAYKHIGWPQTYSDFIAGSITWGGEGKSRDVIFVFAFIASTSLSLVLLHSCLQKVADIYGDAIETHTSNTILYACVPFAIWAGGQVLSKNQPYYELLYFNAWIITAGIISMFVALKKAPLSATYEEMQLLVDLSFILPFFSAVAPYIFSVSLLKLGVVKKISFAFIIMPLLWGCGFFVLNDVKKYVKSSE